MTRPSILIALLGLALSTATVAEARQPPRLGSAARAARTAVMERLSTFICGDGPCSPATPEELASPPVSDEDAEAAISRGLLSGFAAACEADWQRVNFHPMMAWFRAQGRNERQMAIIAGIHGAGQASGERTGRERGCNDDFRANLLTLLTFKP